MKKKHRMTPEQVLLFLSSWKPSEQRHFGPDCVFTHIWWQLRDEQGSTNIWYNIKE